MLNVFSVLLVTRTLSNGTINGVNKRTSTIQLYEEVTPSLFWQLHVVRFPCGREKNMGTYGYTKWTCSQSLTVLDRTISDLQGKKRLFSIRVIPWYDTLDEINVGGSGHAATSSLVWTHMQHGRCTC